MKRAEYITLSLTSWIQHLKMNRKNNRKGLTEKPEAKERTIPRAILGTVKENEECRGRYNCYELYTQVEKARNVFQKKIPLYVIIRHVRAQKDWPTDLCLLFPGNRHKESWYIEAEKDLQGSHMKTSTNVTLLRWNSMHCIVFRKRQKWKEITRELKKAGTPKTNAEILGKS